MQPIPPAHQPIPGERLQDAPVEFRAEPGAQRSQPSIGLSFSSSALAFPASVVFAAAFVGGFWVAWTPDASRQLVSASE